MNFFKQLFQFFKTVFLHFFKSNTFQKGAALAYYAVFSIIPIIIITVSLLGIFFGERAISGEIYEQLKDILGNGAALQVENIIKNQHTNQNNIVTTIIGFILLGFSASGMFGQIHNAFNAIWNIKAKPKNSVFKFFTKRLSSFIILMALFTVISMSTVIDTFIIKYAGQLDLDSQFFMFYEKVIAFLIVSLCFAIMFKFLGDAIIYWKIALWGGMFTTTLFIFGKMGISWYISQSKVSSTFGSASVLALLMIWVYYTSQIIFLGASFIKVLGDKMDRSILPSKQAVLIERREIDKN